MRRMFSAKQMQEAIGYYYNLYKVAYNEENPEVLQIGMPIESIGVLGDASFDGGVMFQGETIYANNLPTEDPLVAGQIWNDNGTLKISAGE